MGVFLKFGGGLGMKATNPFLGGALPRFQTGSVGHFHSPRPTPAFIPAQIKPQTQAAANFILPSHFYPLEGLTTEIYPDAPPFTLRAKPKKEKDTHHANYLQGREALFQSLRILEDLATHTRPPQYTRAQLERVQAALKTFEATAQAIHFAYTRGGVNEYSTLERALDIFYYMQRQTPVEDRTSVLFEGIMLGFNLGNINKIDTSYDLGTVVKLLIYNFAGIEAKKRGGKLLGIWGTNTAVYGVKADEMEDFHRDVILSVLGFVGQDQALSPTDTNNLRLDIAKLMGRDGLSTHQLTGWAELVAGGSESLGLTAGHAAYNIPLDANHGEAEVEMIKFLAILAESEKKSKDSGRIPVELVVTPETPLSMRPLLATPKVIAANTEQPISEKLDPHGLTPIEALPTPAEIGRPTLTPEDIHQGRLPRPNHDGKRLIVVANEALDPVSRLLALLDSENPQTQALAAKAHQYLANPHLKILDTEGQPMQVNADALLDVIYQRSLEQERFPGIYRINVFANAATRLFGDDDFYIQMAEYRDYYGHNMNNPADPGDTMHRLTMDILAEGYQANGVEVILGTQGGDEIFIAMKATRTNGEKLSPKEIGIISNYICTHFERIFFKVRHGMTSKVPPLPGGIYQGRGYCLKEEGGHYQVFYQGKDISTDEMLNFISAIGEAHGILYDQLESISKVASLSKIADVERWCIYEKMAPDGQKLTIALAPGTPVPADYVAKQISLSTTLTPAILIPKGSSPSLVTMAMKKVGDLADEMKRMAEDRPSTPDNPNNYSPVIDFGWHPFDDLELEVPFISETDWYFSPTG